MGLRMFTCAGRGIAVKRCYMLPNFKRNEKALFCLASTFGYMLRGLMMVQWLGVGGVGRGLGVTWGGKGGVRGVT